LPATLQAKCIGSLALKALLTQDSAADGQVVSTFSNSFYLKTGNGELIFFTNRPLRSPITVNLDATCDFEHLVKPLEPLTARGKEMRIGADTIIELGTASLYEGRVEPAGKLGPEFTRIGTSLRLASFVLEIIDTRQSVLDPQALAHSGVEEFVSDGVMRLRRKGTEEQFRDAALKIVGLGSGFTPSGDDTLGGFLATYNSFAKTIEHAPILLDSRLLEEKTSWISARLLDYMQRLILDEQLHHLIDSATKGDQDAVVIALQALLPRGHTSGIDIAVGAILALSLIQDIAFEKEETEVIARALGLRDLVVS
jgi:hypothetical protein